MRKYLIGFLVGIVLSISATTYASDITSLIGKAVQGVFPVKVNGDVLPKTAIVIDGTSYLPVRAIGDAIGYDVSFNADLGIELRKKEVVPMSTVTPMTTPTPTVVPTPAVHVFSLQEIELNIRSLNTFIEINKINIKNVPDDPNIEERKTELKKFQDELATWETRKAALPK